SLERSGSRMTCMRTAAASARSDDPADHVVIVGRGDSDGDEVAGRNLAASRVVDQKTPVDLRSLRAEPPLEEMLRLLARPLDERLDRLAAQGAVLLPGDRALERQQKVPAAVLLLRGHGIAKRLRRRAGLGRVGERADVVELHLPHEL